MNKYIALVVVVLVAPKTIAVDFGGYFSSHGGVNVELEAGYTMLNAGGRNGLPSVDIDAVYAGITVQADSQSNYTSGLEATILYGLSKERVGTVSIGLNASAELSYRGTWATRTPDLNLYWRGSLTFLELEGDSDFGFTTSGAGSGLGLSVGAEWRGLTVGFTENFNDLNNLSRFSVGFRF